LSYAGGETLSETIKIISENILAVNNNPPGNISFSAPLPAGQAVFSRTLLLQKTPLKFKPQKKLYPAKNANRQAFKKTFNRPGQRS